MARSGKSARKQRIVTAAAILGVLAVVSAGAYWYGQKYPRSSELVFSNDAAAKTWKLDTVAYNLSGTDSWQVSANDATIWQAHRTTDDLAYQLEITQFLPADAITSGTDVSMAGGAGKMTEASADNFDGDLEFTRLTLTAQVKSGDKNLQAVYVVRGDNGSLTDDATAAAKTEFTTFLAGMSKQ